jgi:glycosyltransferase 2 family protein
LSKTVKNILKFLVFLGIGLGILTWIFRRQDKMYQADCVIKGIPAESCSLWGKLQADFLSVDLFWIGMVLLAFMVSNFARAHRWQMLMKGIGMRVSYGNAFWTIMIGYMANLSIPRIGEVIRGALLAKYEKQPVEKVLGTIVVDRAVDVISLLFALVLAFFLQFNVIFGFLKEHFGDSRLTGTLIWQMSIVAGLGLVGLWLLRKNIMHTTIYIRIRKFLLGFWEGIRSIRTVENMPLFIFYSVVIWLMYYSMTWMCFLSFGPTAHLGGLAALMVFVFGGLGIVFPSPGGMGTYHAMVMAALALYGVSGNDAFSFANILYFSVQLFCNISFGLLALLMLPLINRAKLHHGDIQ